MNPDWFFSDLHSNIFTSLHVKQGKCQMIIFKKLESSNL